MIVKDGKEITAINAGGKDLVQIWTQGHIVWEAANSCFAAGLWDNDKPWLNDSPWNNG